jgi:hypothetical protein
MELVEQDSADETSLNFVEAFEAMYVVLERFAQMTASEDVSSLVQDLGHMPVRPPNVPTTLTPGFWEDWIEAVSVAKRRISETT